MRDFCGIIFLHRERESSLTIHTRRRMIHGWPNFMLLGFVLLSSIRISAQTRSPGENVFANIGGTTSFPFELSQGVIIVPVSINGSKPLRFVLDSGSTRTLIDQNVASSLGLKQAEESSVQ